MRCNSFGGDKVAGTDQTQASVTGGPVIILADPQLGENIGTSARAMANFGLNELRLVRPRDGWPNDYAYKSASGADWVIEGAAVFESDEGAIEDLNYVYASTARPRDMVKPVITPEQAGEDMRARISDGQKVGILFGRERAGLSNDQISLADMIITAPVNPAFASLNLGQAVLLIAYEWFKRGEFTLGDGRRELGPHDAPGLKMPGTWPATKKELVGFFEHLESELDASGFLLPVEKRPAMVRNIRNMFQRTAPTEQDVRTLRGIVSSLTRTHLRNNKSK